VTDVQLFAEPTTGREWNVEEVMAYKSGIRMGDGDTLKVIRSRIDFIGDHRFRIEDVDPVSVRLVWVDTPERGQEGYREAAEDLSEWLDRAWLMGPVTVIIYESAGWDRLLGNLIRADGESASQYLVMEQGWDIYEEGK
jgi:endonuclease YncB( thermonuclease family)